MTLQGCLLAVLLFTSLPSSAGPMEAAKAQSGTRFNESWRAGDVNDAGEIVAPSPSGARRSLDPAGPNRRSVDDNAPPPPQKGGLMESLGIGKGVLYGLGGAALGAVLGWTIGGPVGMVGLGLIGGGLGLVAGGESKLEKTAGAGIMGAGLGMGLAVAMGVALGPMALFGLGAGAAIAWLLTK